MLRRFSAVAHAWQGVRINWGAAGRGEVVESMRVCRWVEKVSWCQGTRTRSVRTVLEVKCRNPFLWTQRRCFGGATAEIPVEDLLKRADAIKVRKELNSMGEQKISRLDFCRICNKYGFREQESLLLLESFHQSGIVLNFSNTSNTALKETVFIKPQDVLDTIWATFDLNGATRTQEIQRREQELEALSKELGALSTAKALIDEAAEREANRNIWIGGFVPLTAFGLLFRMTYWEYSWDIVEPISFFVSTMGPICFFYVWYAAKKEEFSLAGWRDQMMERSRTNLYRLKSFDLERYNYIVRAIEECKEDIRLLKEE